MVILVVGLKPHRALWSGSARPGESVLNYILMNGCPAIVVPVKLGAPLVAWDALTLEQLWAVELPSEETGKSSSGQFEGIVDVLYEFLDLCVDWSRVVIEGSASGTQDDKAALKNSLQLMVVAAIRSKECAEVKKEIDKDRCGIAFWRIP